MFISTKPVTARNSIVFRKTFRPKYWLKNIPHPKKYMYYIFLLFCWHMLLYKVPQKRKWNDNGLQLIYDFCFSLCWIVNRICFSDTFFIKASEITKCLGWTQKRSFHESKIFTVYTVRKYPQLENIHLYVFFVHFESQQKSNDKRKLTSNFISKSAVYISVFGIFYG